MLKMAKIGVIFIGIWHFRYAPNWKNLGLFYPCFAKMKENGFCPLFDLKIYSDCAFGDTGFHRSFKIDSSGHVIIKV